jgi:hypothetical protein
MFMFVCDAYVLLCDVSMSMSMLDVYFVFVYMSNVLILVLDVYYVFVSIFNDYFVFAMLNIYSTSVSIFDVYFVDVFVYCLFNICVYISI